MATTLPYYEQKDIENIKKLREMTKTLPPFCTEFFRGIEPRTSTRTRIAYAYDLSVFFDFLKKENPVFSKMERMYFTLDHLDYRLDENNYIILTDNRVGWYPLRYLDLLKKRYGVKYVLVYMNPYSVSSEAVYALQERAELVFSYDKRDCEKHNFEYLPTVYSSSFLKKYINREKTWDLVYIGGENGRLNRLIGCFEQIDKSGIKYKFSIIGTDKEKQRYADKICYSTPVEYEKIVEQESKSNTILEVLSDKQMGTTLRALEAVILNKKFLTNNKRIVDLPFYNPKYIQIFDNPEKIDFEFVKREENINYHYKEECSPIRLIEKIHEYDRRVKNENYDHV